MYLGFVVWVAMLLEIVGVYRSAFAEMLRLEADLFASTASCLFCPILKLGWDVVFVLHFLGACCFKLRMPYNFNLGLLYCP